MLLQLASMRALHQSIPLWFNPLEAFISLLKKQMSGSCRINFSELTVMKMAYFQAKSLIEHGNHILNYNPTF